MGITRPTYCTREDVKSALDIMATARSDAQVDRAIEAASDSIDGDLHRVFYPWTGTRYFDWPNHQYARPWRLWLDADELVSVTSLVVAGETVAASDYFLEPANTGPPYTHIEIDLASNAAFSGGDTHQRSIEITGVFGHSAREEPAGALAEALDVSETGIDVTDSAAIGVGDVVKVDSERMLVVEKSMLDTTQNLGGNLTNLASDVTVPVSAGSAFTVGETILIDAERMLVVDIAGNNLVVRRAFDGSVLAAHSSGADIYAPRTLTVTRGALGTSAATHSSAAPVTRHVVPRLVKALGIGEAISTFEQEKAGYARVAGAGENQREIRGSGLADIRAEAMGRFGRKARIRAV